MSSSFQTVEVHLPFSPLTFHSMDVRPILPDSMLKVAANYAVRNEKEGITTIWYPNTQVIQHYPDNTVKVWYGKPTIGNALNMPGHSSHFIQFHKDGAVTTVLTEGGSPFYWSAPVAAVAAEGPFERGYYDDTQGWLFASDEETSYTGNDVTEEAYDSHYYRYGTR